MENLLTVVEERNRAEAELEQGEWIGPTVVESVDVLGRPTKQLTSEHTEQRVADKRASSEELMWGEETVELLRLEREKKFTKQREGKRMERYKRRKERWEKLDYLGDENAKAQHS